jgi:hypothetical protein
LIAKVFLLLYALLTLCFCAALFSPLFFSANFAYIQNYGTMSLSSGKYENKRFYPLAHEITTLDYAW